MSEPLDPRYGLRLPRKRFFLFADLLRIGFMAALLVAILMMREQCAGGVAGFVTSFSPPIDAGPRSPQPLHYVRITGAESEEELRKKLGRELEDGGAAAPEAPAPSAP